MLAGISARVALVTCAPHISQQPAVQTVRYLRRQRPDPQAGEPQGLGISRDSFSASDCTPPRPHLAAPTLPAPTASPLARHRPLTLPPSTAPGRVCRGEWGGVGAEVRRRGVRGGTRVGVNGTGSGVNECTLSPLPAAPVRPASVLPCSTPLPSQCGRTGRHRTPGRGGGRWKGGGSTCSSSARPCRGRKSDLWRSCHK